MTMAMSTRTLVVNGGAADFNFQQADEDGLPQGYTASSILAALPNFVGAAPDRAVVKYILKAGLVGGGMSAGAADARADFILKEPNGAYNAALTIIQYYLGMRT
jgi:hypothetical protein